MKQFFRTNFSTILTLLFALCLMNACTNNHLQAPPDLKAHPNLGIQTYELQHLNGAVTFEGHQLVYDIVDQNGDYYLQFAIDDATFEAWINFSSETIIHDGHQNVLSSAQKEVLASFSNQFGTALLNNQDNTPDDFEIGRMEYSFLRTLEFWSQAPVGFVHQHQTARANIVAKGLGNDGITCIQRNSTYTLRYTNRNNQVISKRRRAGYNGGGTYGCMGRCGANCGRSWIPSAWTLDCFEHDQCSLDNNASGGGSDPNCGNEYWEASDDYIFGVIRGCRG